MKSLKKHLNRQVSPLKLHHLKGGSETTVNKAKMADKAFNKITQYISS
ncbi:hypothetical protein [Ascidiimonas sp. W6]